MPLQKNQVAIAPVFPLSATDDTKEFSWVGELQHIFSRRFFNIAWWPAYKLQQEKLVSGNAFFKAALQLPSFGPLLKTIQKGSFAYNTLFLGLPAIGRKAGATQLADLTCLAILFGDEFIDGICAETGKGFIGELVSTHTGAFSMEVKVESRRPDPGVGGLDADRASASAAEQERVELYYPFNVKELMPAQVLEKYNKKYIISYNRFNELLVMLLDHMNEVLNELPAEMRRSVAQQVAGVCNTCFDTYLHDIKYEPVQDMDADLGVLLTFHETKNRTIQEQLLRIRCVLAGKEEVMGTKDAEGWLEIISIMQYYDDMLDAAMDDGFQDNLLLCIAKRYFPGEHEWFASNKNEPRNITPAQLAVHMPATIQYCYNLIAQKTRCMNWEQKKIVNYLLFKDWFAASEPDLTAFSKYSGAGLLKYLFVRMWKQMPHLTQQQVKVYVIDTAFIIGPVRKYLRSKLTRREYYQLRYNLLSTGDELKVQVFDRLTIKKVIKAF